MINKVNLRLFVFHTNKKYLIFVFIICLSIPKMIAIALIRKQSKHTCTRLLNVEISDHLYFYASLNFRTRIFNQISFTMSTNSSPSNPADATTTSVIINSKIVAFTAMMFFKMTFIQIKTERSAENDPSSSKILRMIKIARVLSRVFTDARNG